MAVRCEMKNIVANIKDKSQTITICIAFQTLTSLLTVILYFKHNLYIAASCYNVDTQIGTLVNGH